MAKEDRNALIEIACDIIQMSMQYMEYTREEIHTQAEKLTDTELVEFITK